MALSKVRKQAAIEQIGDLLGSSKMTVLARYAGTDVRGMQTLRRRAKDAGTSVKVFKNRLVIQALKANAALKGVDTAALRGQLLYAFNERDEAAPAQVIADFIKSQPTLEFVGAFAADGRFFNADEVKALAALPGKSELLAQVMFTLGSPVNDALGGLSGNLTALLDGVAAKATG